MNEIAANVPHRLYSAVWRWHFYAGLFAAPFLVILSITGAIYLFNDELNDAIYPELRFTSAPGPAAPISRLIASAQQAFPGAEVTRVDLPTAPGRTAQQFVKTPADGARRVFVDPVTARVLGSYVYTSTLVGFADVAHGSLLLRDVGDAIVELAACWTVVLVITGLYLWWPRGRERVNGLLVLRLRTKGRTFWRDLHKVTGLYAAALILFLILTGLPWATIWGDKFLTPLSNAFGLGYPEANRTKGKFPGPTVAQTIGETPWTLQQAPMPSSGTDAAKTTGVVHAHHAAPSTSRTTTDGLPQPPSIDVDEATRLLAVHGLVTAYRLTLPVGSGGAYTAYTYPDRPEGQRTIHLDRYTGEVLGAVSFRDYGPVAKAVEWGVALHLGNYFGRLNQIIMLVTCLAIIGLVISGVVMWWIRRPKARLGAPKTLSPLTLRNAALITIVLGALFPLAGASLVVVLVLEWLLRKVRSSSEGSYSFRQ